MRSVLIAGLVLGSGLFAALPAQAQTNEEAELAARKEFVWQYVRTGDYNAEAFAKSAKERMLAEFERHDRDMPPEVKAWVTATYAASAIEVERAITPSVEQRLFDVYFARFTSDDMKKLQAYHDFRLAPERAAIFAEAEAQTTMDKLDFLKSRLPPDDFTYLDQAGRTSPVVDTFYMAISVNGAVLDDYAERFQKEIRTHCDTAPKGVWFCEQAYSPIPTFGEN